MLENTAGPGEAGQPWDRLRISLIYIQCVLITERTFSLGPSHHPEAKVQSEWDE